jgi:hypothetical protein
LFGGFFKTAKGKSVTELWLACLADADSGAISFSDVSGFSFFSCLLAWGPHP